MVWFVWRGAPPFGRGGFSVAGRLPKLKEHAKIRRSKSVVIDEAMESSKVAFSRSLAFLAAKIGWSML